MNENDLMRINISVDTFQRLQREKPSDETFDFFINKLLDKYCFKLKIEEGVGCMKLVNEEDIDIFKYEE